jgi:hypothetical protein
MFKTKYGFIRKLIGLQEEEFREFFTLDNWRPYILNYYDFRISNGLTEGNNHKVKNINYLSVCVVLTRWLCYLPQHSMLSQLYLNSDYYTACSDHSVWGSSWNTRCSR